MQAAIDASDLTSVGAQLVTVANPLASGGVSAGSTCFIGSSGGTGFAQLVISQQSNDLVYDPAHQVIYLSVPGSSPVNGNTISVLSPATGTITSSPFAGSNPDVLAISDDSQFLYAGIDGAASVKRFTLPSLMDDIMYSLGRSSFSGPYFAMDLQVAPGAPHTTAVTLGVGNSSPAALGGITIYDDATARPTRAPGLRNVFDSIQWGSDDAALFAANSEDTGFDFYALLVSASGVVLTGDFPSAFSSFSNRIHFDPGTSLIYADDGHVLDAAGNPVAKFSASAPMTPDSTLNLAFFVTAATAGIMIQSFNLTHFNLMNTITISGVAGPPLRLIRWGQNGLAFNTSGGQVCLIGGNFVH